LQSVSGSHFCTIADNRYIPALAKLQKHSLQTKNKNVLQLSFNDLFCNITHYIPNNQNQTLPPPFIPHKNPKYHFHTSSFIFLISSLKHGRRSIICKQEIGYGSI
jgi:hypothetical protein